MEKQNYVCWEKDNEEYRDDLLKLPYYYPEDAASDYAEQYFNDTAGEVGHHFIICVKNVDTGETKQFGIDVEYNPTFYTREII